jgi:hypothetical protein
VWLTISPPSVSDCLENVGPSTSYTPMGVHGLLKGYLYFLFLTLLSVLSSIRSLSKQI